MLRWSQSLESPHKDWLLAMENVGMLVICWWTSYEMEQTVTLSKKKIIWLKFQTKRNEKPVGNIFSADQYSKNIICNVVSVSNDNHTNS
jgi:hypothetical protein